MTTMFWIAWALVSFTSAIWLVLVLVAWLGDRAPALAPPPPRDARTWPFVTVQVPVFDDATAVGAVACLRAQDYPRDRMEILIADDSTDPAVIAAMGACASDTTPVVRHVHRRDRSGFKPGALEALLPTSRGEIIVVLDADWRPREDFLRTVVAPFDDPRVAIVQTREGVFENASRNVVTRFASALLWGHHAVMMRAARALGAVFFCGTGGAIRARTLRDVGGWNVRSITEDADLSVRVLRAGHRTVYLDYDIVSEVPASVMDFVRQQCRWCFGITQIFFREPMAFLFGRGLSRGQRFIVITWLLAHTASVASIVYIAVSLVAAGVGVARGVPFEVPFAMYLPPVLGPYAAMTLGLAAQGRLRWLPAVTLASLTVGLLVTTRCAAEFVHAALGGERGWVRTPKSLPLSPDARRASSSGSAAVRCTGAPAAAVPASAARADPCGAHRPNNAA